MGWIYIPLAVVSSAFQTARNALQRDLLSVAGPWGATLVRFLFGLPFALLFLAAVALVAGWSGAPGVAFLGFCAAGAGAQVLSTAALLVSMRRSSFAVGTAFQQSALPFAALFGLALGDGLSPLGWAGLAGASTGLFVLSWPEETKERADWSAAGFGLACGAGFGLAGVMFRHAAHAFGAASPILGAAATLVLVQALQSAALTAYMAAWRRKDLRAALGAWRRSLGAGFCGAAASAGWFSALALAPAAAVRAIGVVDMPFAAIAGRRLFRERLSMRQILGACVTAAGVIGLCLSTLSGH